MTIGIYQTSLSGHHGAYARAIALAALERKWKTKILIPEECRSHPALRSITSLVGESSIVPCPVTDPRFAYGSRLSLLQYHFKQHQMALRSIRPMKGQCDFIYVPTLDQMNQAISVLGPPNSGIPMAGMCMRIQFHLKPAVGSLLSSKFRMAAGEGALRSLLVFRGLRCLTTADPTLAEFASKRRGLRSKVRYVPEIGMDPPDVSRTLGRKAINLSPDDKVILLYGGISRRKALPELVAAVNTTRFKSGIRILVVGEIDPEMQEYLSCTTAKEAASNGVLKVLPGFADDETQSAAFAAADAVWVAYVGHQTMSGVFYQAVCAGLPVIAPNYGVMNWLASKFQVGPVVDVTNPQATGIQLTQLLYDRDTWERFSFNAAKLAEAHRPIEFGRAVCEVIDRCI